MILFGERVKRPFRRCFDFADYLVGLCGGCQVESSMMEGEACGGCRYCRQ